MKIKIRDLVFNYSSQPVLDGICFDVEPGRILGIVGPNGEGKSTLIKCIDNILKPLEGSVCLDGRAVNKMEPMEIARHIGYVPQSATRIFPSTVFDMVLMGRRPHLAWGSSERDMDKVSNILELLNMSDLSLRYFNELSGGQQQKVLIARVLAQEAKLLLLDEPTSNLDLNQQFEVMEMIRTLVREKGLSAVVVLHDLNLASRFSDRILMLHRGRIFAAGTPETVLTRENIRKVYKMEALINIDLGKPHIIPIGLSKEGGPYENRIHHA